MNEDTQKLAVTVLPSTISGKKLWVRFDYGEIADRAHDARQLVKTTVEGIRGKSGNGSCHLAENSAERWFGLNFNSADELEKTLKALQEGRNLSFLDHGAFHAKPSMIYNLEPPAPVVMQLARGIVSGAGAAVQK